MSYNTVTFERESENIVMMSTRVTAKGRSSLSLGSEDSDLGFGLDETLVLTFWAGPIFGVHMKL